MPAKISNKKAQVFTLIAIALIGLVFVSFSIYSVAEQRHSVKTRISTMEGFLNSIELNLQRQIYISGFRIIFLAEDEITKNGEYITNVDTFFNEAFFQGTVAGQSADIMLGATYNDLIASIKDKAKKINVDIVMSNPSITISQVDPWHVKMTLFADFVMSDKSKLAKWEKQQQISAYIPVSKFEDPVYTVNTIALISKKIIQTPHEGQYVVEGNSANLLDHVNSDYYSFNSDAPSFLKRLEGDLTADENGIESFVNSNKLSTQGLPVYDKSKIDHIYFSSLNPNNCYVAGMPSWFRIDDTHLIKYNATCG